MLNLKVVLKSETALFSLDFDIKRLETRVKCNFLCLAAAATHFIKYRLFRNWKATSDLIENVPDQIFTRIHEVLY